MSERSVIHIEFRTNDGEEAVDITPFVERFVWQESLINGGFSWELGFTAEAWQEWDGLLFGRDIPTYQFRIRSVEAEGNISTEWRTVITDRSKASFSQDVSMVAAIRGGDRRLRMAQGTQTRAWNDTTVADIVRQIAQEYGLNPDVQDTGAQSSWTQNRQSDWAFLRRIARDSSTAGGRCDTYLWVDEDTLRFRAPTLTSPSDRKYDLDLVESRIEGWVGSYAGRHADRQGAATLRGVGFSFETKRAVIFEMNAASATSQPALAARVPRRVEDGLRIFPVYESDPANVERVVRARWGRYSPRYLAVRIITRPDFTVRPNNIISLEANIDTRRVTPYMGRYVCLGVEHHYERGSAETHLICYRREAQEGDDTPTGTSADTTATRDRDQQAGLAPRTVLVSQELG